VNGTNDNSSLRAFKALIALQWLALALIAFMYALEWEQLPARIATHFNLNNQPNGWMSREGSLIFSLVMATAFAATGSLILLRIRKPDLTAWGLLAFFYVILWTLLYANYSIIGFNVEGRPVDTAPVLFTGIGAAVVVIVLALATRRGHSLPTQPALAEETHASPAFALVLGLPAAAFVFVMSIVPVPSLRVALGVASVVMLAAAAMAWSGFHYLFTPAGVEIRTLGFRLRSIPASEIRSYAVGSWNVLGGYGIRGVGNRRAYVWGNRGVRITTSEGEVFLGHSEPERIVSDLDLVIGGGTSRF
jgi:hypothetical protein